MMKKVLSLCVSALMMFSLVGTAGATGTDASTANKAVDIDKTATELNENDQSTVTLNVGGNEEKTYSDVVFVLDKSTSVDVENEALRMLEELKNQANEGNIIRVGVVIFNKNASDASTLELTELTDTSMQQIEDAFRLSISSGTNVYAGLKKAEAMLDADTETSNANKHVVLVTDGVTYLWGDGQGTKDIFSIYSETVSNGEEAISAGNDMHTIHHPDASYDELMSSNVKEWLDTHGSAIASDIETYEHVYGAGQYKADTSGQQTDSTYEKVGFAEGDYIPGEALTKHYDANDAAVYMAATEWQNIVSKYNGYAYYATRYQTTYPWSQYVAHLDTIGGTSSVVPDNVEGMFDNVKSDILYSIQSGTVTDVRWWC